MTTEDVHLLSTKVAVLQTKLENVESDLHQVKSDVREIRDDFGAFKGGFKVALWLLGIAQSILVAVAIAVIIRML